MSDGGLLASVVISTYNRADALEPTLAALARQDTPAERYEVLVVDDGSTDQTSDVLAAADTPYQLRVIRHDENRGVSAGRNAGMREARGEYLIMLSDDLIVSPNFVSAHVRSLREFPGSWVVGGFRQLDALTDTAFGRYLDSLEARFAEERKTVELAPGIWEMSWPTARNLSLPTSDLDRTGLFDERFRTTCEDQDLAERARAIGIRFIYNDAIDCLHNDAAADLGRYCRFQERGASDTALFIALHGGPHTNAQIARVNGPLTRADPPTLVLAKLAKTALANKPTDMPWSASWRRRREPARPTPPWYAGIGTQSRSQSSGDGGRACVDGRRPSLTARGTIWRTGRTPERFRHPKGSRVGLSRGGRLVEAWRIRRVP